MRINPKYFIGDFMSEKLDKFDLDFNILFTILTRYNLDDLVCVDFSMVHYY